MRQRQISVDQTQPLSALIFEVEHLHKAVHSIKCNLLHCLTGKHFHCYCTVVSDYSKLFFVDVMMVWLHSLAVHSEVSAHSSPWSVYKVRISETIDLAYKNLFLPWIQVKTQTNLFPVQIFSQSSSTSGWPLPRLIWRSDYGH